MNVTCGTHWYNKCRRRTSYLNEFQCNTVEWFSAWQTFAYSRALSERVRQREGERESSNHFSSAPKWSLSGRKAS
jgi:hypothetical protein